MGPSVDFIENLCDVTIYYHCFSLQAKHSVPQFVYPELKNLYNILEVDFNPLKLYEHVKSSMDFISQNEDLVQYVPALEDIIVTRVLKQV